MSEPEDAVLDALGDRTRRQVLVRLRGGPCTVGEIAAGLPVSRPAVSQHLRVLLDAGLVVAEADGTRRRYAAAPAALEPLRTFADAFWDTPLARFKQQAEMTAPTEPTGSRHERRRRHPR